MSERKAVTKVLATEYRRASKARKGEILDQICAVTGWHRNHARKALGLVLTIRVVRARPPKPLVYDRSVIDALRFCWAVQGTPCGRLLAAALPDLVPRLRRFEELQIEDGTAALLLRRALATIDRRLKADRAKMDPRGRLSVSEVDCTECPKPSAQAARWGILHRALIQDDSREVKDAWPHLVRPRSPLRDHLTS
ncbi:MAG: hypothetical protein ABIQ22_13675 [Arthrobacter oryzae]